MILWCFSPIAIRIVCLFGVTTNWWQRWDPSNDLGCPRAQGARPANPQFSEKNVDTETSEEWTRYHPFLSYKEVNYHTNVAHDPPDPIELP